MPIIFDIFHEKAPWYIPRHFATMKRVIVTLTPCPQGGLVQGVVLPPYGMCDFKGVSQFVFKLTTANLRTAHLAGVGPSQHLGYDPAHKFCCICDPIFWAQIDGSPFDAKMNPLQVKKGDFEII